MNRERVELRATPDGKQRRQSRDGWIACEIKAPENHHFLLSLSVTNWGTCIALPLPHSPPTARRDAFPSRGEISFPKRVISEALAGFNHCRGHAHLVRHISIKENRGWKRLDKTYSISERGCVATVVKWYVVRFIHKLLVSKMTHKINTWIWHRETTHKKLLRFYKFL